MAENTTESLERGNIYFFYRPKVEREEVSSFDDVQRFYMVLSPHGKSMYRLIVVPKKKLPVPSEADRKYFAFVQQTEKDPTRLRDEMQEETYETKTRGERTQPAMRPVGEGVYTISRHDDHTHLFYALELPADIGPAQQALNVQEEGNMIISVKNPAKPSPRNSGLPEDQEADYPKNLSDLFRDRRFIDLDLPRFLDYEGTQLLLIGADKDEIEELGIKLDPQQESESNAEIFGDLRLMKSEHPVEPLLEGEWQ